MLKAMLAALSIFTATLFGMSASADDMSIASDDDFLDADGDFASIDDHINATLMNHSKSRNVAEAGDAGPEA